MVTMDAASISSISASTVVLALGSNFRAMQATDKLKESLWGPAKLSSLGSVAASIKGGTAG